MSTVCKTVGMDCESRGVDYAFVWYGLQIWADGLEIGGYVINSWAHFF